MTITQFLDNHFLGICVTIVIVAAIVAEAFRRHR